MAAWFDSRGDSTRPGALRHEGSGTRHDRSHPIIDSEAHSGTLAPGILAWAEAIVDALRRDDRFYSASVLVHDPAAAGLRLAAHQRAPGDGASVPGPDWLVPLTGSLCGWVFRMGRPALVGDVANHADYLAYPGSGTRSELAAPIMVGGRPIGVLNVESPRAGEFGIGDLERLERRAAAAAESLPSGELPAV